jgi:hypothetical protein
MVGYWTHSQILEMLASDKHSSLFDYGIGDGEKSLITLALECVVINVKAMNTIKIHKIARC